MAIVAGQPHVQAELVGCCCYVDIRFSHWMPRERVFAILDDARDRIRLTMLANHRNGGEEGRPCGRMLPVAIRFEAAIREIGGVS